MTFLSECSSGGCGSKIGAGELSGLLQNLPFHQDPNLLVGFEHADDAAVYQINPQQAIISTTDFFPPMVDDPYLFGKIAATNALSDVYAMGGTVLTALNLVCFPQRMEKSILADILRGGAEKVQEAGAVLAGGHSIYDHEPKYGLAVTGIVDPAKVLRNNSCQAGDCLILTKPLGVGLILSAMRVGQASESAATAAVRSMERLNKYAAEKMQQFTVHACTDITGFGLAAHAAEMAGDTYTIVLDSDFLPLLPEALHYAKEFLYTAAAQRNREHIEGNIQWENSILPELQEILYDPQTSGGLLISVAEPEAYQLLEAIRQDDPVACIVGQVINRDKAALMIL